MKKFISLLMILSLMVPLVGCKSISALETTYFFTGTLTSIDGIGGVVSVNKDADIISSGDKVSIYFGNNDNAEKFSVGDIVTVEYDGSVMESDPLQVNLLSMENEKGVKIQYKDEKTASTDSRNDDTVGITADGQTFTIPSVISKNNISDSATSNKDSAGIASTTDDSKKNEIVNKPDNSQQIISNTFTGKIIKVLENNNYIVEPRKGEAILSSGDKVAINCNKKLALGDIIKVTHDGNIMESYPLQINVVEIEKVK